MAYLTGTWIAVGVVIAVLFVWVIAGEITGKGQRREAAVTAHRAQLDRTRVALQQPHAR
jgi:hypothetical protein